MPHQSRKTVPPPAWVLEETTGIDLQDRRLNARLREVLAQLGGRPTLSIPAACGGHAEMTAAYRLFDNPKATFDCILAPHAAATRRRLARQPVALLVQDTTEVDLTRPSQQVAGVGRLDGGARRGAFLHPLHAFTPDGTPLGTLHARLWTRPPRTRRVAPTRAQRAATAFTEKESCRWVQTLRQAAAEVAHCPNTQLVCVADSEADIYEVLVEAAAAPRRLAWIVRASQDRALEAGEGRGAAAGHLWAGVLAQPVLFTQRLQVRARRAKVACETRRRRRARGSRRARVQVRAAQVTLRPPPRSGDRLPPVTVHVVLVREGAPPPGEEPVEWLLLTSLPVKTGAQVRRVLRYYCVRWMIEVFFRVLKSGCRVEARRLERLDRFRPCLALYLIVAWRALYVCRLGRSCPRAPCDTVFAAAEWQAVWQVMENAPPPRQVPPLGDMVRRVAQLGGHVPSSKGRPPGPQTLWIGLQRVRDFALCWRSFGPAP
jgi:hypothetical protein